MQEDTGILCSYDSDDIENKMNIAEKTQVYRIIQECVNNTVKHAKATALKLSINKKDNTIEMTYQDNGQGLKNRNTGKGMGFMSMLERVKILNGGMVISDNSGKGIKLVFDFCPKNFKQQ